MVIAKVEDPREWAAHLRGIFESLEPADHLECLLAERIAICLWKLRRLEFHTMGVMMRSWEKLEPGATEIVQSKQLQADFWKTASMAMTKMGLASATRGGLLPGDYHLPTIMRYEAHLHRQYIQTLHELEAMQARRKGESSPLARLDITGPPGSS
jgi:hypothetical protein